MVYLHTYDQRRAEVSLLLDLSEAEIDAKFASSAETAIKFQNLVHAVLIAREANDNLIEQKKSPMSKEEMISLIIDEEDRGNTDDEVVASLVDAVDSWKEAS